MKCTLAYQVEWFEVVSFPREFSKLIDDCPEILSMEKIIDANGKVVGELKVLCTVQTEQEVFDFAKDFFEKNSDTCIRLCSYVVSCEKCCKKKKENPQNLVVCNCGRAQILTTYHFGSY